MLKVGKNLMLSRGEKVKGFFIGMLSVIITKLKSEETSVMIDSDTDYFTLEEQELIRFKAFSNSLKSDFSKSIDKAIKLHLKK